MPQLRPLLMSLTFILLAVGSAPAGDAACIELGCVTLLDRDADGVPEGVAGGTAAPVHSVPSLSFVFTPELVLVYVDGILPEEDSEPSFLVLAYVEVRDASSAPASDAELRVSQHSEEHGEGVVLVRGWVVTQDEDGDGQAERPAHGVESALLP